MIAAVFPLLRAVPRWLRAGVAGLLAGVVLHAAEGGAAPDDAACAEFGERLAELFSSNRSAGVLELLDKKAFGDRISAGLGFSPAEERDFRTGMLKSLPTTLGKQFELFNAARLLRVQTAGEEKRALVRLLKPDGAVNYMAFVCQSSGDAGLRWTDVYIYLSGEMLGRSIRRTVLPMVAQAKKGVLDRLVGGDSEYVASFARIYAASTALQNGDADKAAAEISQLPPAVRRDRTVLMLQIRAAQALGDDKYLAAIKEWEAAFPNDPTLDLMSIDGDLLRKNYAGALKHIDSLAKRLGGDPYLDFLAGNVHLLAEQYPEARQRAQAALAAEPDLLQGYDVLMAVGVKTKDHAGLAGIFEALKKHLPLATVRSLTEGDELKEFRESDAYREWVKRNDEPAPKK